MMAMLVGGVIGAIVLTLGYFVGVALVGAGLGAALVHLVSGQAGSEPNALVVIVVAVVGAFAAMSVQRHVVIIGTALGGAWTAVVAGSHLAAGTPPGPDGSAWILYPTNPAPGQSWVMIAWIVLAIAGAAAQFGWTAGKKK
jgi:hypothetical protein